MIKITIVGPQEDKWNNNLPLINGCKAQIYAIFRKYAIKTIMNYSEYCVEEKYDFSNIILVSGGCPKGGVDIWAEEMADALGIKKEIHKPEVNSWNDKDGVKHGCKDGNNKVAKSIDGYMAYGYWHGNILYPKYRCDKCNIEGIAPEVGAYSTVEDWLSFYRTNLIGYKSRNVQMASNCDVLYCIVPATDRIFGGICNHCKKDGHSSNGGCWTMKYAKKLGKETHLVVIE